MYIRKQKPLHTLRTSSRFKAHALTLCLGKWAVQVRHTEHSMSSVAEFINLGDAKGSVRAETETGPLPVLMTHSAVCSAQTRPPLGCLAFNVAPLEETRATFTLRQTQAQDFSPIDRHRPSVWVNSLAVG